MSLHEDFQGFGEFFLNLDNGFGLFQASVDQTVNTWVPWSKPRPVAR